MRSNFIYHVAYHELQTSVGLSAVLFLPLFRLFLFLLYPPHLFPLIDSPPFPAPINSLVPPVSLSIDSSALMFLSPPYHCPLLGLFVCPRISNLNEHRSAVLDISIDQPRQHQVQLFVFVGAGRQTTQHAYPTHGHDRLALFEQYSTLETSALARRVNLPALSSR